jgi:glycerol-3-phosphate dehydrogenase
VASLAEYQDAPDAFERVHPDGPDVWAQVYRAVDHEWALNPEDIARRRTTLAVRGLFDDALRARLVELTDRRHATA